MPSSPSSERPRRGIWPAAVAALLIGLTVRTGQAAESVRLEILPPTEELLAAKGPGDPLLPAPGQVLVCGRFDDPSFSVDDLSRLAVVLPDGRQVPLRIDAASKFLEFDRIVSVRFCFALDEEAAQTGGLTLRWGPDVRAENAEADRLVLDPSRPELYRGFRWQREAAAGGDATQVATIEVIADSTAEYHFLWYLLPMGVIFLLLTIRKARARHPAS